MNEQAVIDAKDERFHKALMEEVQKTAAAKVRTFETGATRDTDTGKLDYEGFLSPLVLRRFAEFMHKHRVQTDGSLRDSDNWQKGIPLSAYAKSEWRHHMELWLLHRGYPAFDEKGNPLDLETVLCALWFNIGGYLHEILKAKQQKGAA